MSPFDCQYRGINEEKQFEALSFLLDNLRRGFVLGTNREFSNVLESLHQPVTQMLSSIIIVWRLTCNTDISVCQKICLNCSIVLTAKGNIS